MYLLRLWQVHSKGKTTWRASLESAETGKRQGFANLADLFTLLEHKVCIDVRPTTIAEEENGDDYGNQDPGQDSS